MTKGARPELRLIDKRLLNIDHSYQRLLVGRASQRMIAKIAETFDWALFHVLTVTKGEDGKFYVIDGQHRLAAAMRREDVTDVPCLLIKTKGTTGQARAFLSLNRDRIMPTQMAIFHAEAAAGDEAATAARAAAAAAGVEILRSVGNDNVKPNQTAAIGAIRTICKKHGPDLLTETLRVIRTAQPDGSGMLRDRVIRAVAEILQKKRATPAALIAALKTTTASKYELAVLARRDKRGELMSTAAVEAIIDLCEQPPTPARKAS